MTNDYEDVVKRWNERLTSFYTRLQTFLLSADLAFRLENRIQRKFVDLGMQIEALIAEKSKASIANSRITNLQIQLNQLQGSITAFNAKLLAAIEDKKTEVYYGRFIEFSEENLEKFSTWQLFKALFTRRVNSLSVIRSTLDF